MDWMQSALGEITIFSGGSRNLPNGWIFCNGQKLKEMEYTALYAVIGDTYGDRDPNRQVFYTPNIPNITSDDGYPNSPALRYIIGIGKDSSMWPYADSTDDSSIEGITGSIILFSGIYTGDDSRTLGKSWRLCNGQTLLVTDYPELFKLIGNKYGGNGITTFNLPNLTGPVNNSVKYFMCVDGISPEVSGQGYTAEIRLFSENVAPQGWMICDGKSLKLQDYSPLFCIIGSSYGGDGTHVFKLPNMPSPEGTTLKYMICVNGIFPYSDD
jgi:microcystin-dependent protein